VEVMKMKRDPRPRGGKRVGTDVWFDVTLPLPLGLRLNESPSGTMIGVSEVYEGGSAEDYNRKVMAETDKEKKRNWIQPGDRLRAVNGVACNTQEDAVNLITAYQPGEEIMLKISRGLRGPITVMFPEPARPVVVDPGTRLQDAAQAAGHEVELCGETGCRGSCWHYCNRTGDVYQLCIDECTAGFKPSRGGNQKTFTENLGSMAGIPDPEDLWDNTEPLELRPCPEIANRYFNPLLGKWQYGLGLQFTITGGETGLIFSENGVSGVVLPEDEDDETDAWFVAETSAGTIRLRRVEMGFFSNTQDMESQFKPMGSDEWGEVVTAVRM